MAVIYPTAHRNATLQLLVTAAGSNANIRLYSGTRPPNGGALTGGNTLLAELVGGSTFATVSNGVLTANAITQDNAGNANGTPTFARITTSGGAWVMDIPTPGFPTITVGVPVQITALTIADPNHD